MNVINRPSPDALRGDFDCQDGLLPGSQVVFVDSRGIPLNCPGGIEALSEGIFLDDPDPSDPDTGIIPFFNHSLTVLSVR